MGVYMKFGEIEGDATQEVRCSAGDPVPKKLKETGWIPLESFTWKLTSPITTKSGKGQSQTRGPKHADVHEVTVTKRVDRSSTKLVSTLVEDEKGQDCTIAFVRTGNPGEIYLQYDLKNTLIKQLDTASGNPDKSGDRPQETLTLTFTDLTLSVWQLTEENETYKTKTGLPDRVTVQKATESATGSPGFGGAHPGPQGPGPFRPFRP